MNPENALTIADAPVRVTETGIVFDGEVSFEQWAELGLKAGRLARTSLFLVGDWIVYGETRWNGGNRFEAMSEETRERYLVAMQATGLELQTLAKAAHVARTIPHDQRRLELTFEHHKEVAKIKDADERADWLRKAEKHGLSTRRLRVSIQLGRIAKEHELKSDPADQGINNHIPWLNRLAAWWKDFEGCGWFEQATPEQVEALLRDFSQAKSIIERIEAEAAKK